MVLGMVGGGLWTAIKLIVSPHVKTVERHDQRIDTLERTTVTKPDLEKAETTIIGAVREMRDDLVTRIDQVQRTADAAHQRLDRTQEAELARLRTAAGK